MPSDGIWTTETPARKRQTKHSVEIEITKQIERKWICDLQLYKFTWIWRGFFCNHFTMVGRNGWSNRSSQRIFTLSKIYYNLGNDRFFLLRVFFYFFYIFNRFFGEFDICWNKFVVVLVLDKFRSEKKTLAERNLLKEIC